MRTPSSESGLIDIPLEVQLAAVFDKNACIMGEAAAAQAFCSSEEVFRDLRKEGGAPRHFTIAGHPLYRDVDIRDWLTGRRLGYIMDKAKD